MNDANRRTRSLIKWLAKRHPSEVALAGARRFIEGLTAADILVGVWPDGRKCVLKGEEYASDTGDPKKPSVMTVQVPSRTFAELITALAQAIEAGMSAEHIETSAHRAPEIMSHALDADENLLQIAAVPRQGRRLRSFSAKLQPNF